MFAVLDLVDELRVLDLANPAVVGQRAGVELTISTAESNQYFRVLRGEGSARFAEVRRLELRVPIDPRQTTSQGIVLIEVDAAKQCIPTTELESRYGKLHDMKVPTPRQPPGSPIGYTYTYPGGEVTFGLSRDSPMCVVSVLIDRRR